MLVTVLTDASCCSDSGAAGWAGWAKSERGVYRASGGVKELLGGSSFVCETIAVVNLVSAALARSQVIARKDHLLIQTDNSDVPSLLDGKFTRKFLLQQQAIHRHWLNLLEQHFLSWQWRHVRAHTGLGDSRSAINRWCDIEAGRQLTLRRRALQPSLAFDSD